MPISLIFWIIMLLWFLGVLWSQWPGSPAALPMASNLMLFLLFLLLGWHDFGAPVSGH